MTKSRHSSRKANPLSDGFSDIAIQAGQFDTRGAVAAVCCAFHSTLPGADPSRRLRPVIAIQTPVLHRFGEVLGADVRGMIEVGDEIGDLEDAVVGAGGEATQAE